MAQNLALSTIGIRVIAAFALLLVFLYTVFGNRTSQNDSSKASHNSALPERASSRFAPFPKTTKTVSRMEKIAASLNASQSKRSLGLLLRQSLEVDEDTTLKALGKVPEDVLDSSFVISALEGHFSKYGAFEGFYALTPLRELQPHIFCWAASELLENHASDNTPLEVLRFLEGNEEFFELKRNNAYLIATQVAEKDPIGMLQMATQITDQSLASYVVQGSLDMWVATDSTEAILWLNERPPSPIFDGSVVKLISRYMGQEPEIMMGWAEGIVSADLRWEMILEVAYRWRELAAIAYGGW